ncbi:MAG: aminoglycoside phosphotransferase family protein [Jiangellaceae bacterium]
MTLDVPDGLRARLGKLNDPTTGSWLERLPRLAADFLERWTLRVDGDPMHGFCAMVVPVMTSDGTAAVLKLSWPHPEARDEHRALTVWDGRGAVRLLEADPEASVLLLERLDAGRR